MFVVTGTPYRLSEVREYETRRDGAQRSVSFRVGHPDLPAVPDDKWSEVFEAKNGNVETIMKAAKDGEIVGLVCEVEVVAGKNGKKDWNKLFVLRVL